MDNRKKIAIITTAFGNGLFDREKTYCELSNALDLDIWYCTKDQLLENPIGIEGVIVGVEKADMPLFCCPDLKVAMKFGVGLDAFDLDAAKQKNIRVVNFPGINSEAVAEHVITLILGVSRLIIPMDFQLSKGKFVQMCSHSVFGKTLGIIGMGSIGKHVAKKAAGLGIKCVGYDVMGFNYDNVESLEMNQLIKKSDFITVHVPLIPSTYHIIDEKQLSNMKKGSILINTARGGIVDDESLISNLENNHLGGAGLDVFENESTMKRLANLQNTICTPHVAAYTHETLRYMEKSALRKMHDLLFEKE